MALRRFAHENNGISSPRTPDNARSTPRSRPSFGLYRSPAETPSLASSTPFDWDAARSRAPPPYATPNKTRSRMSIGVATPGPKKPFVRKKGLFDKLRAIPSDIAFHIALFPDNLPLPTPKSSARIIGGACHFLHLTLYAQSDPESWEGVPSASSNPWLSWSTLLTVLLVGVSFMNTYNLCTRTRNYQLHNRTDAINSPNAKFINKTVDLNPMDHPSAPRRFVSNLWFAFSFSWRWLLGLRTPSRSSQSKEKTTRVQELDVWQPNDLELEIFSIYSPAHTFLWFAMNNSNWITVFIIMGLVGIQLNALVYMYTQLVKDRQIIASETMREYNEGFVWPRIHPVKRDAAVMTHQSEVVNVWED